VIGELVRWRKTSKREEEAAALLNELEGDADFMIEVGEEEEEEDEEEEEEGKREHEGMGEEQAERDGVGEEVVAVMRPTIVSPLINATLSRDMPMAPVGSTPLLPAPVGSTSLLPVLPPSSSVRDSSVPARVDLGSTESAARITRSMGLREQREAMRTRTAAPEDDEVQRTVAPLILAPQDGNAPGVIALVKHHSPRGSRGKIGFSGASARARSGVPELYPPAAR
jgi:hypothetical protein